jgi:3-hydroxyisobutyrate dehydrogenase-like beta-hydroxyacid dehydrogenase
MRVGFVGLGNMGLGMARNVAKANFPLRVRDLRPEAVDILVGDGAAVASTAAEAARDADLVCIAVFNEAQLRATILGAEGEPGVLTEAAPGSVIAVHSTVSPGIVLELAEHAHRRGVELLDVAMSGGGDIAANAGTLTFMVGGAAAAFERSRPVFETMANTIFHVGRLGAGMSAKIVSNFLLDGNVTLVREAIRIASSAGIDEARILEIISSNRMGSSWVSNNWEQIRAHEDSSWNGKQGVVDMYHKDLRLAHDLAQANGVDAPTLRYIVSEVSPTVGANGLTR